MGIVVGPGPRLDVIPDLSAPPTESEIAFDPQDVLRAKALIAPPEPFVEHKPTELELAVAACSDHLFRVGLKLSFWNLKHGLGKGGRTRFPTIAALLDTVAKSAKRFAEEPIDLFEAHKLLHSARQIESEIGEPGRSKEKKLAAKSAGRMIEAALRTVARAHGLSAGASLDLSSFERWMEGVWGNSVPAVEAASANPLSVSGSFAATPLHDYEVPPDPPIVHLRKELARIPARTEDGKPCTFLDLPFVSRVLDRASRAVALGVIPEIKWSRDRRMGFASTNWSDSQITLPPIGAIYLFVSFAHEFTHAHQDALTFQIGMSRDEFIAKNLMRRADFELQAYAVDTEVWTKCVAHGLPIELLPESTRDQLRLTHSTDSRNARKRRRNHSIQIDSNYRERNTRGLGQIYDEHEPQELLRLIEKRKALGERIREL